MTKVKICGITSLKDALAAAEYGADALGFVFYKGSPRYIEPAGAADIIGKLPPFVVPVALFVNEDEEMARAILKLTGINVIQFHGDESPEYVSAFDKRVIKALRVKDIASLEERHRFDVNAFLLDAFSADAYGGTGECFNWDIIEVGKVSERVILAGGLTPGNVISAIGKLHPYGVDVSSGVESSPGVKDHDKLREFIKRAKEA